MYSIFWQDALKVLLYSLLLGAGLPVVYAIGVRSLAIGGTQGGNGSQGEDLGHNPLGLGLAAICFVVVLAGVAVGLAYVIAAGHGDQLSFSHGYPTFVPKS